MEVCDIFGIVFHLRANLRFTIKQAPSLHLESDTIAFSVLLQNSVKMMGFWTVVLMAAGKGASDFGDLSYEDLQIKVVIVILLCESGFKSQHNTKK